MRGLIGPWVHQLPHLSSTGPSLDWVGEVLNWSQRHASTKVSVLNFDDCEIHSERLQCFVSDTIPLGPSLPTQIDGSWVTVDRQQAQVSDSTCDWYTLYAILSTVACGMRATNACVPHARCSKRRRLHCPLYLKYWKCRRRWWANVVESGSAGVSVTTWPPTSAWMTGATSNCLA